MNPKPFNSPATVFTALALMLLVSSAVAASAQDEPYRVLVLHSFRNSLPVNTDWYHGIVRGFTSVPNLRVELEIEAPDLSHFNEAGYVSNLLDIYRHKYRALPPQLIIPTYTPALRFLLDYGEDVFPGIPIVFCGADTRFVAARELAPHITGVTTLRDIAGTLELALHLHPDTQRVAVIVGSGDMDKEFERDARQAFLPLEGRFVFTWLQGLPLDELGQEVKNLPNQTVILYLIQLADRTGKTYVPRNVLQELSAAANAPIYGLWDTLLDAGITGGRVATLQDDGFRAAQTAVRILRGGEAPAAIPVVYREQNGAIFHGRQLVRWNIDEAQLPQGSRILHRQRSIWDEHRKEIIAAGFIAGIQGFLIVALLLNRARLQRARTALQQESDQRAHAQTAALRLRSRLRKFSKDNTLGAMATGIAHEINQPLIAIQNYAQAAKRRIRSTVNQTPKVDELLGKIESQAAHAGDIIQRIRNLVNTDTAESCPQAIDPILEQAIQAVAPEIESRGCRIDCRPATDLPMVLADSLQIQLVLVNLLHNAMHSIESNEDKGEKTITIELRQINHREVRISVADRGPGVPADTVEEIFEHFYSGRADGMGLGLTICQTIIEAHGGRIWYTPNPSGGAIFHFTLPLAAA